MINYFALFAFSVCFGLNFYNWVSGINRQLVTKLFTIFGFIGAVTMYCIIEY